MPRTDLYLKVQVSHDARETPEKLASEICRTIRKMHGVRAAELSSFVTNEAEPDDE